MGKVHFYMCLHIASIKSTARNKTRFFLFGSPFILAPSSRPTLAEAFQTDYIATFSTALRSATETIELGGYVTVPCPSKTTQRSTTVEWFKLKSRH